MTRFSQNCFWARKRSAYIRKKARRAGAINHLDVLCKFGEFQSTKAKIIMIVDGGSITHTNAVFNARYQCHSTVVDPITYRIALFDVQ